MRHRNRDGLHAAVTRSNLSRLRVESLEVPVVLRQALLAPIEMGAPSARELGAHSSRLLGKLRLGDSHQPVLLWNLSSECQLPRDSGPQLNRMLCRGRAYSPGSIYEAELYSNCLRKPASCCLSSLTSFCKSATASSNRLTRSSSAEELDGDASCGDAKSRDSTSPESRCA